MIEQIYGVVFPTKYKKRKEDLFIPNIKVYIGFVLVEQLQVTTIAQKYYLIFI